MTKLLDIAEVARLTGLTSRALRFYEARSLIAPLRTASGRRAFGTGELERIHGLLALKRAGLSLAQIKRLLDREPMDLRRLIAAQLDMLAAQQAALEDARALLATTLSRIDRGEPIDAETFCSLIRTGDMMMEQDGWRRVTDRYFTPEEKAQFAESRAGLPADFDQAAYSKAWEDLSARIEAQLPLDPAGEAAQALLAEWRALLAPFKALATPAMMAGTKRLYDNMDEWRGEQKPPFSMAVWQFIQAACVAGSDKG